jgi:CHAD domain-containing protein
LGGRHQPIDLFRQRLASFARELGDVERGSVDALHRMRVASRRLRELLPLLQLNGTTSRKLDRQLRRVTKQLGVVRELDVLIGLIDDFGRNRRYSLTTLRLLSQRVGHTRDSARERLAAKLPTWKLERLVNRLERAVSSDESSHAKGRADDRVRAKRVWLWALDARLARRAARVQRAIEMAGALYVPERLHDVRIALKKLRYAAELSLDAGRPRLTADVAALKAAQDLLGRLHDYEVLITSGRNAQASLFPPDLAIWRQLKRLVDTVEDDCRQMHGRYMRDRKRLIAIANRLGAGQAILSGHNTRAS